MKMATDANRVGKGNLTPNLSQNRISSCGTGCDSLSHHTALGERSLFLRFPKCIAQLPMAK